jgi:hypothetical protein
MESVTGLALVDAPDPAQRGFSQSLQMRKWQPSLANFGGLSVNLLDLDSNHPNLGSGRRRLDRYLLLQCFASWSSIGAKLMLRAVLLTPHPRTNV